MDVMRKSVLAVVVLLAVIAGGCAQTNCVWIERSEGGTMTQKVGVSTRVAKLLAHPGSTFGLGDVDISYDTLLAVCRGELDLRMTDAKGKTEVHGGRFSEKMKEETAKHNYLIVESTDGTGGTKVEKIRVESLEAIPFLVAMIGSKESEADMEKIESALERGGVLYVRDFRKNTRLWIYVN